MNIFVLSLSPAEAARYHCDKHVVKMAVETAQILSTVHHKQGSALPSFYKPTHPQHPCTVWAGERAANYRWTHALLRGLLNEYTRRYGKRHKTERLLFPLRKLPADLRNDGHEQHYNVTDFALAGERMHLYIDPESAVQSYRNYYIGEKAGIAKWKYTETPAWFRHTCDTGEEQ